MIKRKELVDYANSKKAQALQCTKIYRDYFYLETVNALCKCAYSLRDNKRANIEAFKLSETHFDNKYQFGYEQFIKNTIEANLAMSYIYILSILEDNGFNVEYVKHNFDYRFTRLKQILHIIDKFSMSNKDLYYCLYHIELYCKEDNIDLHFFVDKTLDNMEYNIKNRI